MPTLKMNGKTVSIPPDTKRPAGRGPQEGMGQPIPPPRTNVVPPIEMDPGIWMKIQKLFADPINPGDSLSMGKTQPKYLHLAIKDAPMSDAQIKRMAKKFGQLK